MVKRLGSDYDSPKHISFIITNSLHSPKHFRGLGTFFFFPTKHWYNPKWTLSAEMTGGSLDKPMRLVPIHVHGHTVLGYNLVVYTYNYRCHIKYHIKESIIVLQCISLLINLLQSYWWLNLATQK